MPSITRRDFLNGVLWTSVGTSLGWPMEALSQAIDPTLASPHATPLATPLASATGAPPGAFYPPALTGLRGSHPGAFEAAHTLAWTGQLPAASTVQTDANVDCVIIGAGISGLSAALFYLEEIDETARILILDNHDDFGGHAKRNEFTVDGLTLISYGGTQSFDTPSAYSKVSRRLLASLGIDLRRLLQAYDQEFFDRLAVGPGIYCDAATFGKAALLRGSFPTVHGASYYSRYFVPGLANAPEFRDMLRTLPLSATQLAQLRRVMNDREAPVAYFRDRDVEKSYYEDRYVDYLKETFGITDPALLALLGMPLAEDYALVGHGVSLANALGGGLLGLPPRSFFAPWIDPEDLPEEDASAGEDVNGDGDADADADADAEEYAYHYPDGNATLARLLVKKLIPGVADFDGAEACVTARFDYARLDQPGQQVNLRLNSLAVLVERHTEQTRQSVPAVDGTPSAHTPSQATEEEGVRVQYFKGDALHAVRARHCIMAGWHMMAAHIIPSLPEIQSQALRANLKMPLVYAQVVLRQWRPLQQSGVIAAYCPGAYFQFVVPDFPVHIGAYRPPRDPSHPMVLLMIRNPCPPQVAASVPDLLRMGRADLLGTTLERFETEIRAQLAGMYAPFGFAAERDLGAITINRWPHGYVYEGAEYNGEPAYLKARKRHGNIVFANADSSGQAYTDAAIDSAWRAVSELT